MNIRPTGTLALRVCATVLTATAVIAAAAPSASIWKKVPEKDHLRASPVAKDPEAITAGADVYREHCQQCHKADARGDERHPSVRAPWMHSVTDGDMEWYLRQGDRAHGMPSWASLPSKQRWQLIAYLRSLE